MGDADGSEPGDHADVRGEPEPSRMITARGVDKHDFCVGGQPVDRSGQKRSLPQREQTRLVASSGATGHD